MHPIELMELLIVFGILLAILIISFVVKGKWRKVIWGLAVVYLISFSIFYLVRPYWIDLQIENKTGYLHTHLKQKYPKENWEFWTVPHREDGYESMNPYTISVTFENEPEVEYTYFVRDRDDIIQTGYSSQNEVQKDLLHLEKVIK